MTETSTDRRLPTIQRAVQRAALAAGIRKRVTPHGLRHAFASHLLASGCDIRTIQTLLGHLSVETTMIYTRIADALDPTLASPLDGLQPPPPVNAWSPASLTLDPRAVLTASGSRERHPSPVGSGTAAADARHARLPS